MEKFYFEIPSLKRKEDILDFLDEFVKYNSDLNGAGYLDKILYENYTFEDALVSCLNMHDKEYAKNHNRATSKTFLLIRENDNKIVGISNIRWNLPKNIEKFGGNIGYSIRPTERRKGYNKINLYLGLLETKKLGLDTITLDCESTNIASYKTMESLGGKLLLEEIDPYDGLLTKVYKFDVNKCVNDNKDIYTKYLSK